MALSGAQDRRAGKTKTVEAVVSGGSDWERKRRKLAGAGRNAGATGGAGIRRRPKREGEETREKGEGYERTRAKFRGTARQFAIYPLHGGKITNWPVEIFT